MCFLRTQVKETASTRGVYLNIYNKHSLTADMGWPHKFGVGSGAFGTAVIELAVDGEEWMTIVDMMMNFRTAYIFGSFANGSFSTRAQLNEIIIIDF
jgi:hypothetical protein